MSILGNFCWINSQNWKCWSQRIPCFSAVTYHSLWVLFLTPGALGNRAPDVCSVIQPTSWVQDAPKARGSRKGISQWVWSTLPPLSEFPAGPYLGLWDAIWQRPAKPFPSGWNVLDDILCLNLTSLSIFPKAKWPPRLSMSNLFFLFSYFTKT